MRHLVLVGAVSVLLAAASYALGAPAAKGLALSPSAMQIDPKRPNIVYASTLGSDSTPGGVFKSTDAGKTWRIMDVGLTQDVLPVGAEHLRVDALALDPRSPSVLYAGTGLGIFKTTDGGRTWKPASTGIDFGGDPLGHRLLEGFIWAIALDPRRTSTVYAAGGGLWKSTNGGATWRRVLGGGHRPVGVAVDSSRSDTVYVSAMRSWRSQGTRNSIYRTVDGGRSWRATGPTELHDGSFAHPVVVDRLSPGTVYAGGRAGLFASRNRGETWSKLLSPGSAAGSVNAIALDPLRPNTLYVGGWAAGIQKSTDGGKTWSSLPLDMPSISTVAIAPTRKETVYAGGDGIWKSTDGGATWHRLTR